jgi:hypothetical protein
MKNRDILLFSRLRDEFVGRLRLAGSGVNLAIRRNTTIDVARDHSFHTTRPAEVPSRGPVINAPTELADFSLKKLAAATAQIVLQSLLLVLPSGWFRIVPHSHLSILAKGCLRVLRTSPEDRGIRRG